MCVCLWWMDVCDLDHHMRLMSCLSSALDLFPHVRWLGIILNLGYSVNYLLRCKEDTWQCATLCCCARGRLRKMCTNHCQSSLAHQHHLHIIGFSAIVTMQVSVEYFGVCSFLWSGPPFSRMIQYICPKNVMGCCLFSCSLPFSRLQWCVRVAAQLSLSLALSLPFSLSPSFHPPLPSLSAKDIITGSDSYNSISSSHSAISSSWMKVHQPFMDLPGPPTGNRIWRVGFSVWIAQLLCASIFLWLHSRRVHMAVHVDTLLPCTQQTKQNTCCPDVLLGHVMDLRLCSDTALMRIYGLKLNIY